jgi:DNA primase
MFSKKFIDDVRASADIVEIVGEKIELRPFPGDRHKGLCPFHNESSPSFSVDNRLFYCFGCGEGGDCIRFVERIEGVTFSAAVRALANRYGIVDDDTAPRRPAKPIKRKISGIRPPINYVAPKEIPAAVYDAIADGLWRNVRLGADERQSDCDDLLLTLGIVPTRLIEEMAEDGGMSHLWRQ